MSKKKARQPQKQSKPPKKSRHKYQALVILGLVLCLGLTTVILAQWRAARVAGTTSSMLAAAPLPQTSPTLQLSKEYIYAGGRLIATEEPVGTPSSNRTNVALATNGGVATALTEYDPVLYPASAANNGDRKGLNWGNGGGWQDSTASTYPDWLQVKFNGHKTIDQIDVFTIQDNLSNPVEPNEAMAFTMYGITAFDVQYWNGSTWTPVPDGIVTSNNKVWRKFTFPAVTTDRIRVVVNNALFYNSRIVEVQAWGTPAPAPQSFVTGKTLGALRNDFTGNVGMKMTTSSEPLTITSLGRIYVNGNSGTHTLKVMRASDNAVVASVDVSMSGGSSGQFKYAGLPMPMTLAANTAYYVVSMETNGGDQWYDYNQTVLTTTSVASANSAAFSGNGLSWGPAGGAGNCYVPVDFQYMIGGTPPRTNIALASSGAAASASSTVNNAYLASSTINGDRLGLNWGSGGGWNDATHSDFPDSLDIDFGVNRTIDEIDVFTLQDSYWAPSQPTPSMTFTYYGLRDYKLQSWNGTIWVDIPGASVSSNNLVWKKFTFSSITTSRVRLLCTGSADGWSRVTELEAWGY